MARLASLMLLFLCILSISFVSTVYGRYGEPTAVNYRRRGCRYVGSYSLRNRVSAFLPTNNVSHCCKACFTDEHIDCTAFSYYKETMYCYLYDSEELEWIPNDAAQSGTTVKSPSKSKKAPRPSTIA